MKCRIITMIIFSLLFLDSRAVDLNTFLIDRIWRLKFFSLDSGLYIEFKFTKEGKLELVKNFTGEPIAYFGGDYTVKNNNININYSIVDSHMTIDQIKDFENQKISNTIPKSKIVCNLISERDSYYYEYFIKCNNNTYIVNDSLIYKPNTHLKYKNIDVITINKIACANDNVKLRDCPDVNSKSYPYIKGYFEQRYDFLPKGVCFNVLLKTKEKYQVSKWNNYWYLIDLQDAYQEKNSVWVFGEFVQFKN